MNNAELLYRYPLLGYVVSHNVPLGLQGLNAYQTNQALHLRVEFTFPNTAPTATQKTTDVIDFASNIPSKAEIPIKIIKSLFGVLLFLAKTIIFLTIIFIMIIINNNENKP